MYNINGVKLDQGSPNYGPRSHFIRPAKPFCQW